MSAPFRISPPTYTQVPNEIFELMPQMTGSELKVILAICRQTFGWHKESDKISLSQFESLTGLSRQSVLNGLSGEISQQLIERVSSGDSYTYRLRMADDCGSQKNRPGGSQKIRPEVVKKIDRGVVKKLDTQKKALKKTLKKDVVARAREGDDPVIGESADGGNDNDNSEDLSFLPAKDDRHRAAIIETLRLLEGKRQIETLKARTYGRGLGMTPAQFRAMRLIEEDHGWTQLVAACTIGAGIGIPITKIDTIVHQWTKIPDNLEGADVWDGVEEY